MAASTSKLASSCCLCAHASIRRLAANSARTARRQFATQLEQSQVTSTKLSSSTEGKDRPATDGSAKPASPFRIVASMLLSRPPRRMKPMEDFEREYYKYSRKVNRAISSEFDSEWYFRKGSQGEQGYQDLVRSAAEGRELEESTTVKNGSDALDDMHSSDRMPDRTLYFLAKKDRKAHTWQFPQGGVEGKEDLIHASIRELREEFGQDLDVWQTGKIPAASYAYTPDGSTSETRTFFMPARYMRGNPEPNKSEGLVDFAWCTREEMQERVDAAYFAVVEPALSE